ncbi:hypothetical protein EVAR_32550_1 [Eumeta japonica]|uniref:Uncharacterized protein n=1 Tax=Eumeta variegata TaxID=151549 RepID=A0A4C1VRU8_EUMVA|nr:hypothetical protein EVAR_32550_1 [Eumeta japonica]
MRACEGGPRVGRPRRAAGGATQFRSGRRGPRPRPRAVAVSRRTPSDETVAPLVALRSIDRSRCSNVARIMGSCIRSLTTNALRDKVAFITLAYRVQYRAVKPKSFETKLRSPRRPRPRSLNNGVRRNRRSISRRKNGFRYVSSYSRDPRGILNRRRFALAAT